MGSRTSQRPTRCTGSRRPTVRAVLRTATASVVASSERFCVMGRRWSGGWGRIMRSKRGRRRRRRPDPRPAHVAGSLGSKLAKFSPYASRYLGRCVGGAEGGGGGGGGGGGVRGARDPKTVAGPEPTATMVLVMAAGLVVVVGGSKTLGRGRLVVKPSPPHHHPRSHPTNLRNWALTGTSRSSLSPFSSALYSLSGNVSSCEASGMEVG